MGELVKSVLGSGRSLVVGWILPTVLNVLLFAFLVLPLARYEIPNSATALQQSAVVLATGAILGVFLAAIQTPIYRVLGGYVGWRAVGPDERTRSKLRHPWATLLDWSHRRQLSRKQILARRLDLMEITPLAEEKRREELLDRLLIAQADRRLDRYVETDARRGEVQAALLREQVRRYPVEDQQVVPTRLGNAIRRLEEYGYDRYRLDSQTLLYELMAVAPEQSVTNLEKSRITVDFMVSFLVGHVLVALTAVVAAGLAFDRSALLLLTAAALTLLAWLWYRMAVASTDDWAAAFRGLVNLGRKPLIKSLGLRAPATLSEERDLWAAVSRLSDRPFDTQSALLDRYRTTAG